MKVDMDTANPDQAAAWNGEEGERWTRDADRYDRAGRAHWRHLLSTGFVGATDHVLDVGCGTGKSTRDVGRVAAQGTATGVDLSGVMLDLARERALAEGLTNVTFVQGDAQVHPFDPATYDVAVSVFGAMFFSDPVTAFANIATAMKPGARLALLAWRDLDRNEWLLALRHALALGRELPTPPPDVPTPFALADPDRARARLAGGGFADIDFSPVGEPMDFGADAADAFAFGQTRGLVHGLTHDLDDEQRAQAFANLERLYEAHETPDGVLFASSAWLITATRT